MENNAPHLSSEDVAAYVSSRAPNEVHARIQAHLADCEECADEIAEIVRSVREARAGWSLRRRWMLTAGTAAVAAVVLALLVGPRMGSLREHRGLVFRGENRPTELVVPPIEVIEPENRGVVPRDSVRFSWKPVDEDALYSFTLTNSRGDVLWKGRTRDTVLSLSAEIVFQPGQNYLWYVDALYQNSKSTSTGALRFRVK